jgi:hypothetical protein
MSLWDSGSEGHGGTGGRTEGKEGGGWEDRMGRRGYELDISLRGKSQGRRGAREG